MTIDGEPAKVLLPFLQRADELQKHDHLVAYYCRLYAMEKGLKIPPKQRTSETKALLISLMNQLEKDKKVVQLSADDNMHMEGFALQVFAKADKQDRAGRADLNTAKTFYAASIFFEVLLQFGELPPDIQEKQKYAGWKAVDIRKALAENRKPIPGPPGGEKDAPDEMAWNNEGNTNGAPENVRPISPSTLNRDTSQGPTSMDTSHRSFTSPPSEPPPRHSYSKSSEDMNLPSAPSNPIPPSYGQNPYASTDSTGYLSSAPPPSHQPSLYSHNSGTPFDSLGGGGNDKATPTVGTYSYPSDPPGYSTPSTPSTPSSYSSYPSSMPQGGPPQQDPSMYHQHSQQWPSSPFNDPTSTYPSVFPSAPGGYPSSSPQYPSIPQAPHGSSRFSEQPAAAPVRQNSAPAGPPESSGGYQMNGSYDSNFKPSPGQVAEAHKASRFAVSALAFDDIPTAISYLRKSLELLTSPSAST